MTQWKIYFITKVVRQNKHLKIVEYFICKICINLYYKFFFHLFEALVWLRMYTRSNKQHSNDYTTIYAKFFGCKNHLDILQFGGRNFYNINNMGGLFWLKKPLVICRVDKLDAQYLGDLQSNHVFSVSNILSSVRPPYAP